jgi:hypothetical protein
MSPTRTFAVSLAATGGWCFVSAGTGTTVIPAVAVEMPSLTVYAKLTCSVSAAGDVTRMSVLSSSSTTSPLAVSCGSTCTLCTASTRPLGLTSFASTETVTGSSPRR